MKLFIAAAFAIVSLTACQTERPYTVTDFEHLPENVREAIWYQIGDAEVVSVHPTTVAGEPGYYQINYIEDGHHKSLKVDEHAVFLSKSDWGYQVFEEAAGAERR